MKKYKKKLLLVPSAYNSKVMGDISNFIEYYKDSFDVYVLYDKKNKIENGVTYLNNKDKKAISLKYTADYIIDAGSIDGKTRVSNSQKRVSVWHGIPYKKMFIDLNKEFVDDSLKYSYGYDLMVSPSKFYTEEFLRNSMLYDGEILETAISRTDNLFKSHNDANLLKEKLSIPKNKKVLLYAPTYRKKGKFKLNFDVDKLLKELNKNDDEWVIVTKLHYLNKLDSSYNVIDCTNYSEVNDILSFTDLLITDYSSLMFDYSILKKPCIFYQYDSQLYNNDRGFMFNLENFIDKKYIVESEEELLNIISRVKNQDNLNKIRDNFYPHQKRNSTKKLVNQLNFDSTCRNTKDIIFLINELNQIGGVHNFILNFTKAIKKKCNSKIYVFSKSLVSPSNDDFYEFDKDNIVDIKLSADNDLNKIIDIINGTDGYIISLQFGAHKYFQKYLSAKNNILMFHGDCKDVINKSLYKWHLDALNNRNLFNYKKLLLLTGGNKDVLYDKINANLRNKLDYIENSYDFSRKDYYKKNGEFAFVSRLDEDKNIFDILDIFANKNINDKFILHVYGDGKLRPLFEDKIKKLKLDKKIIIHGYCSNKDEMYKDKQGVILTSLSEGFSLIVLEASNYGIPVYLYNSFTAASEFKSCSNIHLIESTNISQFVKELNLELKPNKKSFDDIVDRFSNETIINKWLKLFDEIEHLENVNPILTNKIKIIFSNLKKMLKKTFHKVIRMVLPNNTKLKFDLLILYNNLNYCINNIFKRKNNPLVSIVIPYYNNYNVIENLLKSIENSGYKNYEILLINDGSEDDLSSIIKNYKYIKYFNKKNSGPGETRNYGIEKAKGKYIYFIDSDDVLCKYSLNHLVDYAEKNKLDLVCGRCRKIQYKEKLAAFWKKEIYTKTYINKLDKRHMLLEDTISTAKLYNLKTLKESNIRFKKGLYEDKLFMSEIYQYYENIGIINKDVYDWYSYGNGTSITTSYTFDNIKQRVDKMQMVYDLSFNRFKMYYISIAVNHDLSVFVNNFINFNENERKLIFKLFLNFFNDKKRYIYNYNISSIMKKEIVSALLKDDYARFCIIAQCISYKYLNKRNLL